MMHPAAWSILLHIITNIPTSTSLTELPNTVTGTQKLTIQESPYGFPDGVEIPKGTVLQVEGGVEIQFPPGKGLDVYGDLVLQGNAINPVTFTIWEEKKTTSTNSSENIRLLGANDDHGVIQVKKNGIWATLCDSRLSDPNRYRNWITQTARVMCRDLGLPYSSSAYLATSSSPPTRGYARNTIYDCDATHDYLDECPKRNAYCDFGSWTVEVRCESTKFGEHWAGITYHNTSISKGASFLSVFFAGVQANGNLTVLSHAVKANGVNLALSNALISDSAGHGIYMEDIEEKFNIENVSVTNSRLDGIHLSTKNETGRMVNLKLKGNRNGLVLNRQEILKVEGEDFCSVTCIRCQHTLEEFPLKFKWHKLQRQNVDCTKVFSTVPGSVILIRPISATYYVFVSIRDGDHINSPFIYQSNLANGQLSQPMPAIITQSDTITIQIKSTHYIYYRYEHHFMFELHSGLPGSFGIFLDALETENNRQSGLLFLNLRMPITVSKVIAKNNTDGLKLDSVSAIVNMEEISTQKNHQNGIFLKNAEGFISVARANLSENQIYGVKYHHAKSCDKFSMQHRFATVLKLERLMLNDNQEKGINLETTCRVNISVIENSISGGKSGMYGLLNYNKGQESSNVYIHKNNMTAQSSDAVKINGYSSLVIEIRDNIYSQGKYSVVNINLVGGSSRFVHVYVTGNRFQNIQTPTSVLYINVPRYSEESREYVIKNNVFTNIELSMFYLYHIHSHIYAYTSSVVYLKTKAPCSMTENVFNIRNDGKFLYAGDEDPKVIHDAKFNYWGSHNINDISNRVYGYNHNILLAKIKYVPYLESDDINDKSSDSEEYPDFIQGSDVGGVFNMDQVLSDASKPYHVVNDIVVLPNASLEIGPGVTLLFDYGMSLLVHGKLTINGESQNPVNFDALPGTPNKVRLIDGPSNVEGFVQVLHNNTWHILCYNSLNAATLDILCFESGGLVRRKDNEARPGNFTSGPWLSKISCVETFFKCTMEEITDQCNQYQYLTCHERHWSGIHLAIDAKPATIKHVSFNRYGQTTKAGNSALLIEYLNHNISDIMLMGHINATQVGGIKVLRTDAVTIPVLHNINIFKTFGYGFATYNSRLTLSNLNLTNTEHNNVALYITEEMQLVLPTLREEIIEPICSRDTIEVEEDDVIFFDVDDIVLNLGINCSVYLMSMEGFNIAVQVISGVIPECGKTTLLFYDGHKNDTEPQNLRIEANGMIWRSTGEATHLLMRRHHHYRYRCMKIYLRVWAIPAKQQRKNMLTIKEMTLHGFKTAMQMTKIRTPVTITNITIGDCNTGLAYSNSNTSVSVFSSAFQSKGFALQCQHVSGQVQIISSTFKNSNPCIDLIYGQKVAEDFDIIIDECDFKGNTIAIRSSGQTYSNYFKNMGMLISNSVFEENEEMMQINIGSKHSNGYLVLHAVNNTLRNNKNGIDFKANNHKHHVVIQNNTFIDGGNGWVLYIEGQVEFLDNIVSNWTLHGGSLIDINNQNSQCEIDIASNVISDNRIARTAVKLSSRCQNTSISGNIIENNIIEQYVIDLAAYKDDDLVNKATITNNRVVGNQAASSNPCILSSSFNLGGFRHILATKNVITNPQLKYEVFVSQSTQNQSSKINLQYNYFGTDNPIDLAVKIFDGRDQLDTPVAHIVPYYVSESMDIESTSEPVNNFFLANNNVGGRLTFSLTLQEHQDFLVTSDVIIPSNVTLTLLAGTILKVLPLVSIFVHGKLNAVGSISAPVVIRSSSLANDGNMCNNNLRLIPQNPTNKLRGRLEQLENGVWKGVCITSWALEDSHVACRQLGHQEATTFYTFYSRRYKPAPAYDCLGTEDQLERCPHHNVTANCYIVGLQCSDEFTASVLHFLSRNNSEVSHLQNVVVDSMKIIQVSGTPPKLENVLINNTQHGLIYFGAGVVKEVDVSVKNTTIKYSGNSGVSLFDITSNVTIMESFIEDIPLNGIFFSSTVDGSSVMADHVRVLSTFRFCDVEPVLFVSPGEEYKFFSKGAQGVTGCRRIFQTDSSHSILVGVYAATTSRNWIAVASFYEGDKIMEENKINTVSFISHTQNATIQSWDNTMSVNLITKENFINYAFVTSVPKRANDCSFEDGDCGWKNYDSLISMEWGNWTIFSPSEGQAGNFKGLQKDVTFPGGKEGHYMYVGSGQSCSGLWDYYGASSMAAVLHGPTLFRSNNICELSFYHYRSIGNIFRGEALKLYVNDGSVSKLLWSSAAPNNYDRWLNAHVKLDQINVDQFSLLFHARYVKRCPNSVGIDDIKFMQCPKEKLVSTISIRNVKLQNVIGNPMWIKNSDPNKHNVVWIERSSIKDSISSSTPKPAVGLSLKSAYVLIRNTDFSNIIGRTVEIVFDSETKNRVAEVTLTQNTMRSSRTDGVISVWNRGIKEALVWLVNNDIQQNTAQDKSDVIQVINASLVMDGNLIYNNTGRYILQLGSINQNLGNMLDQNITNNIFWFNSAQQAAAKYTILANASTVKFNQNLLNNPANTFEFSAQTGIPSSSDIDCSNNWWGSGRPDQVRLKIRSSLNTQGLPAVSYQDFWMYPPSKFGLSSSCPVGWSRQGSHCMLYRGGAVVYVQAIKECEAIGATLLLSDLLGKNKEYIASATQYRDVDGSSKFANIWVKLSSQSNEVISTTVSDKCHIYVPQNGTTMSSRCSLLRPYICEKFSVVLCKNSCFQNGLCSGKTCVCNKGWGGEDCSEFHCKDVNECSGRGECVGPNQCQCKAGWQGRACSRSYCSRFNSCLQCSKRTGCGWCDSSQLCIPGDGIGPDLGKCHNWFYYKCLTIGANRGCSPQIYPIECDERYCKVNNTETNQGLCQECDDVQNCYHSLDQNLPYNITCPAWDEEKCPQGIVYRNYSKPSRKENTVLADNVINIDPKDLLIYFCPVLVDKESENLNVYITREEREWEEGKLLTSPQAGGIFSKLNRVIPLEKGIVMLFCEAASITDMIKYADFRDADIPFQRIGDALTVDQAPQNYLMTLYLNESLAVNDSTQFYTLLPGSMKCIGHEYKDSNGATIYSYYAVVPVNQDTLQYSVGDVIVSALTRGFLETVENITTTKYGTFVFTQLTQCSSDNDINIRPDQEYGDMNGEAGDNWPGLVFYNSTKKFNAREGESIVGRRASGVFGKIISKTQRDDHLFLEVVAVETIEKGQVLTAATGSLSLVRRRKRSTITLSESGSGSLSYTGAGFSVSAKASYSASLKLTLKVSWDWFSTVLEEAGWTLTGKISNKLDLSASLEKKFSKSGSIGDYRTPDLGKFFIYLIPGRVFFDVSAGYELSVSAKATLTVSQTQDSTVTVGSRYTRSSGIKSSPPKKSSTESRSVEGKLEGQASASLKVTPQIRIQWPLWYGTKDKERGRRDEDDTNTYYDLSVSDEEKKALDLLPGELKAEAEYKACIEAGGKYCGEAKITGEGAVRDELTSLEVAFRLPMSLTAAAKACDTDCKDPDSQTSLSICGKVDAFQVAFAALVWEYVVALKLDAGPCKRKCSSNLVPCCLCEDDDGELKPGKLDPKTKECLCPCFCDPPDNTVKSVKKKGEECMCEECPDGTLKRWYQDIKCPCTCADEPDKEKEMEKDGTCDCPCKCEDGSKDKVDAEGKCPCECECKNCQKSTLGPDGCKCPDDTCPVCEAGAQADWKDCKCECPENPCGEPPACASGRTGSKCELPHCANCPSCSGSGVCTASSASCASSCQCSPQWMGQCCERRRPNRRTGDPHLDTVDGQVFDYFGIGQFWDCYSEVNDFGYQVRFYYYGQTSFTGAIAIKAHRSVVTVTTVNPASISDMPVLRINGTVTDIRQNWAKMISDNQVKLDVNHNTQGGDDTGVVILSLQFKTGISLSLDIRFSPKMKRQYINIQYVLTKDFWQNTAGLCGYMDDDMSNDLRGPDGTIYNGTEEFVESWRIQPMVRPGAGMQDSWSWTESNFHPDDQLDISYNDPNFIPNYSLSGFSQAGIYAATMLCSSKQLTGALLDGCIYDVVITNDTTFTFQEILKTGCQNQCSGKGRCVNSVCQCAEGWSGKDCSNGACGRCVNGRCQSGFCQCDVGWEGDECAAKATCYGVNNCTDEDHGRCLVTDKCLCHDGFIGDDCSVIPTCFNAANCSQQGICVDYDKCKCHLGYVGPMCQQYSCEVLQYCSSNGKCIDLDMCICNPGWIGINCGMPDCKEVNHCSGYGNCVTPGQCKCISGFSGKDCGVTDKCPQLDDCNDRGICAISLMEKGNETVSTIVCRCDFGYSGKNCTDIVCDNDCSENGECTEPNLCQCNNGYTGSDCSNFSCETKAGCSGHGNCSGFETCSCERGWSGEQCDVAECSAVSECSNQGYCITPDTCECYDGFQGSTCSQELEENVHSPVFNESNFNVTIKENARPGTVLVKAFATDDDTGDNGKVRYSLDVTGSDFDLGNHLVIDNTQGIVTLVKPISRNLVQSGNIDFKLVAADKGIPSQTAEAIVRLQIEDINDNCPVFTEPANEAEIFVNASTPANMTILTVNAEDADFGLNGQMVYKFTRSEFFATGLFYLDRDSGQLVTTGILPVNRYTLDIMATDLAATPCSSAIKVFLTVYPSDTPPVLIITTTRAPVTTSSSTPPVSIMTTTRAPVTTSSSTTVMTTLNTAQTTRYQGSSNTPDDNISVTTAQRLSTSSEITTHRQDTSRMEQITTEPMNGAPTTSRTNEKTSPPQNSLNNRTVHILAGVLGAVALISIIVIISLAFALQKANQKSKKSAYAYENELHDMDNRGTTPVRI